MKKLLIASAALAMVAGTVQAQSSVTISGRIDQSIAAHDVGTAGQGKVSKVNSGTYATSRITISATEDLGGGLRAGFALETQLNPDIGAAGAGTTTASSEFFNRDAFMFIGDAKLGTLSIGRITTHATDSDVFVNATASHVAGANQALVGNDVDVLGDKAKNSVAYTSPTFSGLTVQAFRSAGEQANGYDTDSVNGISARYTYGKLKATVANVVKKVTTGKEDKQFSLGASYDFGVVRAGLIQVVRDNTASTPSDKTTVNVFSLAVPVNAKVTLIGALHDQKNDQGAAYDAKATVVGATYDFSKRTAAYVTYAKTDNESSAAYKVTGLTGAAGKDEKLTSVGIKHFF